MQNIPNLNERYGQRRQQPQALRTLRTPASPSGSGRSRWGWILGFLVLGGVVLFYIFSTVDNIKPEVEKVQETLGHKSKSEEGIKTYQIRNKKVKESLYSNSLFASRNSRTYHKHNCPQLNTEDLIEFTSSQKAQEAGGLPCELCNPMIVKQRAGNGTILSKGGGLQPYISSNVTRVKLRSSPSRGLSKEDVKNMLGLYNFYDSVWNNGGNFTNDYEAQVINGDKVVIDHATGLMWHQSGSLQRTDWGETYQWVRELNRMRYARYQDWRLPTIDEAVTLLESRKYGGGNGLHIDPVFDSRQKLIWTSDVKAKTERSWIGTTTVSGRYWWRVSFTNGTVSWLIRLVELQKHIRPVRTMR